MTRQIPKDPETTRERILDAAMDIFSTKGYHDARVDDIVERSSTSKGSVYFHFPNKEKLFLALVDKFADLLERRVIEAISQHDQGMLRVRAALEACLETFGRYRRLAKIMLVQAVGLGTVFENKRREVLDRFADLVRTYLDEAIALGEIRPVDTQITAVAWTGSISELVIRWVYTGEPKPDQIMDTLLPLLLRSVGYEDPK
jgi:AcrR family transcriptional regulator